MNRAKIEWAQNPDGTPGYTWNPITGCLNHQDGMCKGGNFPCYAYRLAHGRLKERYLTNVKVAPDLHYTPARKYRDSFYPRFWPRKMQELLSRNSTNIERHPKPRGVFVCDMSDLFGIGVPAEWTRQVLQAIKDNAYDRFYLLTKQPQELPKWSPFPENCWVGVTVTDSSRFALSMCHLQSIKAKVKYLSFEPLLDHIGAQPFPLSWWLQVTGIDWLIIGAQTKPYRPPKIEWVQEIVQAADRADIPVFLKDNLVPLLRPDSAGASWPGDFVRQEMPTGAGE